MLHKSYQAKTNQIFLKNASDSSMAQPWCHLKTVSPIYYSDLPVFKHLNSICQLWKFILSRVSRQNVLSWIHFMCLIIIKKENKHGSSTVGDNKNTNCINCQVKHNKKIGRRSIASIISYRLQLSTGIKNYFMTRNSWSCRN